MTVKLSPEMIEIKNDWQARKNRLAAERAAWPERWQTVRDAIELGFWPDAYGGDPSPPPTKFGYPRGGLAYPWHAHGRGAGAIFSIWCFATEPDLDAMRHKAVWHWGSSSFGPVPPRAGFDATGVGTLDQAFWSVIEMAMFFREHYIVPDPGGWPEPWLRTSEWRELIELPGEPRPEVQLGMFDDPIRGGYADVRREIRDVLQNLPGDQRQTLPLRRASSVADLCAYANRFRFESGRVPVLRGDA